MCYLGIPDSQDPLNAGVSSYSVSKEEKEKEEEKQEQEKQEEEEEDPCDLGATDLIR